MCGWVLCCESPRLERADPTRAALDTFGLKMGDRDSHSASKDAMLKSQLGIYGKAPGMSGRGKKSPRGKKAEEDEPDSEPRVSPEEAEAGKAPALARPQSGGT